MAKQRLYGLEFPEAQHPVSIEIFMVEKGGQWKGSKGQTIGRGINFHFKRLIKLIWPEIVWHKWIELFIDNYLTHRTIVVMGPGSSGKTCVAAFTVLADYYCFPNCTTVMVCSNKLEMLDQRIWGEVKSFHKRAKERIPWIPGNLIESRRRMVTDARDQSVEGRDFRNGFVGIPCLRGESFVGLGDFAGVKNKRVRLVGDELSLLPRMFVDAISNLDKNDDFKAIGLGNPKDTTDALGVLAEPAAHLGGWEGGIDQGPGTKTWEIKRPQGICLQFPGSDSPNLDGRLGIPLITQEQINRDVAFYTKDSLWYTMMNEGRMPRGQGSRRVITRQLCDKFGARNKPEWADTQQTIIAWLDAAYRGVGGDRCMFGTIMFGEEVPAPEKPGEIQVSNLVDHSNPQRPKRMILSLGEAMVVPIKDGAVDAMPEDQIVNFIMEYCNRNRIPPENLYMDAGMRTSLVQAFGRLWSPRVNSIDCMGVPTERRVSYNIDIPACDYYSKRITEIWYRVRLVIEAGQFRGMTEDAIQEFCGREFTMVGGNKIEVEPKRKMKAKFGRSPDLADGIAIGVEGAVSKGFIIRKLGTDLVLTEKDNRWRQDVAKKSDKYWKIGQLQYESA